MQQSCGTKSSQDNSPLKLQAVSLRGCEHFLQVEIIIANAPLFWGKTTLILKIGWSMRVISTNDCYLMAYVRWLVDSTYL